MPTSAQIANLVERLLVEQRIDGADMGDPTLIIVDHHEWLPKAEVGGGIARFFADQRRLRITAPRQLKALLDPEPYPPEDV